MEKYKIDNASFISKKSQAISTPKLRANNTDKNARQNRGVWVVEILIIAISLLTFLLDTTTGELPVPSPSLLCCDVSLKFAYNLYAIMW